ncbi:MAG: S1/P1 Nuclease, partial [Chitinophagaceae bacterium]
VRYIASPQSYIWERILESSAEVDSVLRIEQALHREFRPEKKYAFEMRKGKLTRTYSPEYTRAYHQRLAQMVERRMKTSVVTVASFWYTAWINAGQPVLPVTPVADFSRSDRSAIERLDRAWRKGKVGGKSCEEGQ